MTNRVSVRCIGLNADARSQRLRNIFGAMRRRQAASLGSAAHDEFTVALAELRPDPFAASTAMVEQLDRARRLVVLQRMIGRWTERERLILALRLSGLTLDDIGEAAQLSRERVRQIVRLLCRRLGVTLEPGRRRRRKTRIDAPPRTTLRADVTNAGESVMTIAAYISTDGRFFYDQVARRWLAIL